MREVLYEESINPTNVGFRKTISICYKIIKIITVIVGAIFLYIGIMMLDLFSAIFALILFGSAFLFGFLQRRIYYCVDCIFVSGSTRLIRVVNYKARRKIIVYEYDEVEQVGRTSSESFEKLYLDKNVRKIFATPNKYAENSFYVYLKQNGENILVIMDCKEDYLKNLVAFAGRKIIEKDYQ